jgi:XTP/dITP diphosphohydrolase
VPTPGSADRLLLVTYSPRLPAGVLSRPAWEALRAGPVYAADNDLPQAVAVQAAGIEVRRLPLTEPGVRGLPATEPGVRGLPATEPGGPGPGVSELDSATAARAFRDLARGGATVVWLAGPDGDPGFVRALGDLVARGRAGAAEVEVVYGSWDPPGARLLDVVAVMDRLRSPGGCPWDAEQTHATLAPYLLEEAYEMLEAIEDGDVGLLREELGDVLLQVVFHARLAQELPEPDRWSVDDVAADLVDKLVRRHPHVFGDRTVAGAAEVEANWEVIKAAEKGRSSVTEGVPLGQPALSLAAKLQSRAAKAGLRVDPPTREGIGERLFALVAEARAAGVDPEAALRSVARGYLDAIRAAEATTDRVGRDDEHRDG